MAVPGEGEAKVGHGSISSRGGLVASVASGPAEDAGMGIFMTD
jgi:hypothetical protein